MYTYKLEVSMTPMVHDNPKKPFYWCLFEVNEKGIAANYGFGWAATVEEAFKEGKSYYDKYAAPKDQILKNYLQG